MVSVIVPIYKVERFIRTCIESIINQTYKDLEIILVDDGSPDDCGSIIEEYAKIDSRVRVIHKINGGLSDARNAGLEVASGEYVTFVDSDDFILPRMIEDIVNIAEQEGADVVECQRVRCAEEDTIKTICYKEQDNTVVSYDCKAIMANFLVKKRIRVTAWAKLYRRSLFSEIRFPYGKYHEDVFTTYKILHLAKKVSSTERVGYVYRINSGSIMQEKFSKKSLDSIEGKLLQADFVREHYPELRLYADAEVIYACNMCMKKMAKVNFEEKEIDVMLRALYKKYIKQYLRSGASLAGKVCAIAAFISLPLTRKFLRLL